MNPFLLTQMNQTFVPDRQTDIVETTPGTPIGIAKTPIDLNDISAKGYYVGAGTEYPRREKMVGITIYRFDIAHQSDVDMLKADGSNVVCVNILPDNCHGAELIQAVFGLSIDASLVAYVRHDGKNTPAVCDVIAKLYLDNNPTLFVIVQNDSREACCVIRTKDCLFENLVPCSYGLNNVIYHNSDMLQRLRMYNALSVPLNVLPEGMQPNRNPTLSRSRGMFVQSLGTMEPMRDTEYFKPTPNNEPAVMFDVSVQFSGLEATKPDLIRTMQTAGVHISVDTEVPVTALLEQWKQSVKHLLPLPESFYADDLPDMSLNLTGTRQTFALIGNQMNAMAKAHQVFSLTLYHDNADNCETIYKALMTKDTGIVFDHIARPSPNIIQLFVTKPQGA